MADAAPLAASPRRRTRRHHSNFRLRPSLPGLNVVVAVSVLAAAGCAATEILLPAEVPKRVAGQILDELGGGRRGAMVRVLPPGGPGLAAESFEVSCADGGGHATMTTVRAGSTPAALFGVYELARRAGFGFMHPLHIVKPARPDWCQNFQGGPLGGPGSSGFKAANANVAHAAMVRGTHIHTQHPIELADVLNGVGRVRAGGGVGAPSEEEEAWKAGLRTWTMYLQWLVANKQNLVEWALLEWGSPDGFSTSDTRRRRLSELVAMAQEWGLRVAIDAPMNLQQQHAWRLQTGDLGGSWEAVVKRIDWVCSLGVDEVSTEIGSTEFSHTDPHTTVALLNTTVAYLSGKGRRLVVKNHVSTKQVAKGYKSPLRGSSQDLNFNYITYHADPRVISAPHTVQMYALEDPLVGSYGRHDFGDVREMMGIFEREGKPQVFFPETAYWVDFDNSVPLFLPLYATDRLRDIQLLAREAPSAGHLNFESGWALGYWVNNAAQALAAWRRGAGLTPSELFRELLAPLGDRGFELAQVLVELAELQNRTLVQDVFLSPTGARMTLVGYLQGWEGMAEAQEAWQFAVVQPSRVHPRDLMDLSDWYLGTLAPRLRALREAAYPLAERCHVLREEADAEFGGAAAAAILIRDACVGVELFALRAQQVDGVCAAASGAAPERGLARSAMSIDDAAALIKGLDLRPEWTEWSGSPLPTAYPYGYLWPAASLFFWRRDHQLVSRGVTDACYLNLYDIVELGLPYSSYKSSVKRVARWLGSGLSWLPWFHKFAGCLSGPTSEPALDPIADLPTMFPTMPPQHQFL